MEFRRRLSNMFAFLTLMYVAATHVSADTPMSPQQTYWNSILPHSPMPKALSDLLDQTTSPAESRPANKNFTDPDDNYVDNLAFVAVAKDGIPDKAATLSYVFLENDIHPGKTMTFSLGRSSATTLTNFLPRKTAESIPFSSTQLPLILNRLSVNPGSTEASLISNTIRSCESPVMKGEEKYCATSLESMIDLTISKLGSGSNIQAISADVEKGATHLQQYTISPGVKRLGDKFIACHKMSYPYAVFGCHTIKKTRAYMVPLQGADGTKEQAVAVCHADTSEWPSDNFAFKMLNVKPGTVPICHFLPEGHLVWVPRF